MKIIFFGTPGIAIPSLEALHQDPEIEIEAVVTQADKPVGRKKTLSAPPIKELAEELGLKVLQPKNKSELENLLKDSKVDFFVVFAFGMIFPANLLKVPKQAAVNIHTSLLPNYRGASPIQESLLHGDNEIGISIMQMGEKLDQGPVYFLKRVAIDDSDNLASLSKKLAYKSAEIIGPVLKDIIEGQLRPIPQDNNKASYCHKITKQDGEINWQEQSAEQILNMIRAYTPWPGVYTTFNNKKLKILEATTEENPKQKPGKFFLENKTLKIATKSGNLLPQKLQLEGKQAMDVKDFVNGNKAQLH